MIWGAGQPLIWTADKAVMSHNNGDGNWENDFVNSPSGGGRKLSDILYIAEAGV